MDKVITFNDLQSISIIQSMDKMRSVVEQISEMMKNPRNIIPTLTKIFKSLGKNIIAKKQALSENRKTMLNKINCFFQDTNFIDKNLLKQNTYYKTLTSRP